MTLAADGGTRRIAAGAAGAVEIVGAIEELDCA
jgi:hypothetical protein